MIAKCRTEKQANRFAAAAASCSGLSGILLSVLNSKEHFKNCFHFRGLEKATKSLQAGKFNKSKKPENTSSVKMIPEPEITSLVVNGKAIHRASWYHNFLLSMKQYINLGFFQTPVKHTKVTSRGKFIIIFWVLLKTQDQTTHKFRKSSEPVNQVSRSAHCYRTGRNTLH